MLKKYIATTFSKAINAHGIDNFIYLPKLAFVPSIVGYFGEEFGLWYIENEKFLFWVFLILMIDHILGSIVHWSYTKDFSPKKNIIGLITKIAVIVASYAVLEGLHSVFKQVEWIEVYFTVLVQISLLLYPGLSAMKNIHIISDGKYPPAWFFKHTEEFNETGDLSVFKTTKEPSTYVEPNYNYDERNEQKEF